MYKLSRSWILVSVLSILLVGLMTGPADAQSNFIRGDVNCNGAVNVHDAVMIELAVFSGFILPCNCPRAADVNVDGTVSIVDGVVLLSYLFAGGPPPAQPFPNCGPAPGASPLTCVGYPPCPLFKRGDADQDGCVSPLDAQFIQNYLFTAGPAPSCMLAADANDDDIVDHVDAIYILNFCSTGGAPPPAPGPLACGPDPSPGSLSCGTYSPKACGSGCRNQLPSDCNQDGTVDLSDSICLLGYLFLGAPASLPCGNGSGQHPGNIVLLSGNGDFLLDISDATYLLNYLFTGGPPPSLGTRCTYIEGCPQNVRCPGCLP